MNRRSWLASLVGLVGLLFGVKKEIAPLPAETDLASRNKQLLAILREKGRIQFADNVVDVRWNGNNLDVTTKKVALWVDDDGTAFEIMREL